MSQYLLSRLTSCRLAPTQNYAQSWHPRFFVNHSAQKPAPKLKPAGVTLQSFLTSLGRGVETKVKADDWKSFWKMDGHDFRKAGLSIRDRRYIMWCMEKYRQGLDPKEFAHEAQPKKKIRGHGPAVQNGKRIRSRRKQ